MIEFKALGGFELLGSDGQVLHSVLAQPKRQALLAYLAVATPRGFHRRDTILGLLWPELDDAHARAALNKAVHQLRGAFGADVVLSRGQNELGLDWQRIWCDAAGFEAAIERAELAEGLALYRGDLLPGFFVEEAAEFDNWLELQRTRLRSLALHAAQVLSEKSEKDRDLWASVRWTQRAIELEPFNEVNVRRLMVLLEHNAGRAEALHIYDDLEKKLARELEVEPEAETRTLRDAIRARSPARALNTAAPQDVADSYASASADEAPPPQSMLTVVQIPPGGRTPTPGKPMRGRPARVWAGVGMIVVVVAIAAFLATNGMAGTQHDGVPTAVLPFAVDGDSTDAYLSEELMTQVSKRLDESSEFEAVDPKRVRRNVRGADTIYRTAKGSVAFAPSVRARFIVTGRVTRWEGRLSLIAALYDTLQPTAPRAHASVIGPAAELPRLVDEIARQLVDARPTAGKALQRMSIARSSRSGTSVAATVQGQDEYVAGRFGKAVTALRAAVEADSTNAYAYMLLSLAANFSGDWALSEWANARAIEFRQGLTPFDHLQARAWNAYMQARPQEAEALLRTLLAHAPDDPIAWFTLGEVLYHWGPALGTPLEDAAAAFDHSLADTPDFAPALIHRVRLAAVQRDTAILQRLLARRPNVLIDAAEDLELRLFDRLRRHDSAHDQTCAELATLTQDLAVHVATLLAVAYADQPAVLCVARAVDNPRYNAYAHTIAGLLSAELAAARGKYAEARRVLAAPALAGRALEYRAAFALAPLVGTEREQLLRLRDEVKASPDGLGRFHDAGIFRPRRSYLVALVSVRLGDTATASRYAAEMSRDTAADLVTAGLARDFSRVVRAELLRVRGRTQQALDAIMPSRTSADHVLPSILSYPMAEERWLRAELLHELGRDDEALRWYGTFPDPAGYDLMYVAASHLRRAEIYDKRGDHARAIKHYNRVIDFWADADPQFAPYVQTARARVNISVAK